MRHFTGQDGYWVSKLNILIIIVDIQSADLIYLHLQQHLCSWKDDTLYVQ